MNPHIQPTPMFPKALLSLCAIAFLPLCGFAQHQRVEKPLSPDDAYYLAQPANPALPTLFIIGDSTVRNGNGQGGNGQWGWGDLLAPYFDTSKINVVNDALGGTSSRTFYRDRWPGVKAMMKPGDVVIMQFGHNDSSPINEDTLDDKTRARGTIEGIGPETTTVTNILTKRFEVVHSYGWYLEQFIAEARTRGATPMVCSLIPRNEWVDGHVRSDKDNYAGWASEVAADTHTPFLDLNVIIGHQYDLMGRDTVNGLFVAGAGPHTSKGGAKINAACVISALKGLRDNPLEPYFSKRAIPIAIADLPQPKAKNKTKDTNP